MHHAVMRMCISHRLSIIYTQKWGFGGFEGELLCSIPQKALYCVNTRLLVYRMSKSVEHVQILCTYKETNTENKQELSYRQQIVRKLRTEYAEIIYRHKYYTMTLKTRLI